ncbi:MAG: sigma-70 family RNA polymerase sigma factor [Clostridiales bacterium]|nr:sigma-70 family RNA polymerase sigma factor [Clostridiales bacterium]
MRQKINQFLLLIAEGDQSALEELSRLVSGRLLSIATSILRDRGLAEEVVQDSFVRIVYNAGSYKPNTNGYAWICRITQNLALNTLRRERRIATVNIDDCFSLAATDDVFEQSSAHVILKQAMSELTPLERWILYQKYFMDLSVREIAQAVGKSKSAVQRALASAEDKVRKFINCGTSPHK